MADRPDSPLARIRRSAAATARLVPALDPRAAPRVTLVAVLAFGAFTLANMAVGRPGWLGVDYLVYELAAEAALRGEEFYAVSPPGFAFEYVYPPATVALFVPFAVLPGWHAGFAVFTLTELAASVGVIWTTDRFVRRISGAPALARTDHVLVGGVAFASASAVPSLFYGQVNHHVTLALAGGLLLLWTDGAGVAAVARPLARRRETLAGAVLALPAIFKLFPAAVGAYLLRRRAWRAIAAAVVTAALTYLVGLAAFGPEVTLTYVDEAVLGRLRSAGYPGGIPADAPYVTLRRAAGVLFTGDDLLVTLAPIAALLPPLAWLYRDVSTPRRQLLAAHGTVVALLLVVPSYVVYVVYAYATLLPLCYVLGGWPRVIVLAGTLLTGVAYTPAATRGMIDGSSLLPGPLDGWLLGLVDPLLTLGSPPLWGLLLTLVGCLLATRRHTASRTG